MTTSGTSLIGRVRDAVDVLYREMVKFGVVGAVAFVVDMGLFNLLLATVLSHKPTTSAIISALVATVVAWVGNRAWTFRHRRNRPIHHEAMLFALTNGVALVITAAVVWMANYAVGVTSVGWNNVAKFLGIALGTLFRFWAYRTFVFAAEPISVDTSPMGDTEERQAR